MQLLVGSDQLADLGVDTLEDLELGEVPRAVVQGRQVKAVGKGVDGLF